MIQFFADLQDRYNELHTEIFKAFENLPAPALDWKSTPETNSIAVLVTHLLGAERYWIGDVVMKDPSDRDREAEFKVENLTPEQLKNRLLKMDTYIKTAFESLILTDLELPRISPRSGGSFTVGWSLLHALEHTALHLGHIQLTCQLWGQSR